MNSNVEKYIQRSISIFIGALEQAMQGDDSVYRNVTEKWLYAAPISFQYERGTERSKRISRAIYKFYFDDKPITVENGANLGLVKRKTF